MIRLLSFVASVTGAVLLVMAGVDWRGTVGVWLIVLSWHLGELGNDESRERIRRDHENDKWLFNGEDE